MSIHVVDVSRGVVAAGMAIEVYALDGSGTARREIGAGAINAAGLLADPRLAATFAPGRFEALFHVADYYRKAGLPLPAVPFLDVVVYRFGIADGGQHYHLPFKCTPWGYSCFRGGA
jgi:5-hydroxyisourate hydrolase